MRLLTRSVAMLTGAMIVAATATAWSKSAPSTAKSTSAAKATVVAKATPGPIYNEATKSYFEFREYGGQARNGWSWETTAGAASQHFFKGTAGRLAVIDSPETMAFIQKNFHFREATWIGLRLFCSNRKLLWVNGKTHERTEYSPWHPKWHRTHIQCGESKGGITFMPVYLKATPSGYRWQASGQHKNLKHYLVEYPTGHP